VRRSFPNMLLTAGLLTALLSSGLFAGDEPPKPKDPPRGEAPKWHLHQPAGPPQAAPLEQRLQALEQKLDLLLNEVRQLRRERRTRPDAQPKARPEGRKPKPPHAKPPRRPHAKPPVEGFHGPFGPGKPPAEGFHGPFGPASRPSKASTAPLGPGKPPVEGFHGPFGPGKPPVEGRRGPDGPGKPPVEGRRGPDGPGKPPVEGRRGPDGPGKPPVEGRRGPDGPGKPPGRRTSRSRWSCRSWRTSAICGSIVGRSSPIERCDLSDRGSSDLCINGGSTGVGRAAVFAGVLRPNCSLV
jgi:hypothetical protein